MRLGFAYILECCDSYYTGSTTNLERRLTKHNNDNGAKYTKVHKSVKLVYYEKLSTTAEAFKREKQIQM